MPHLSIARCFFVLLLILAPIASHAQDADLVQEWILWPNNSLGQAASNVPGPVIETPATAFTPVHMSSLPLRFFGENPTERIENALPIDRLPKNAFSIEMWVLDHVNQPVGALITARDKGPMNPTSWLLGYYEDRIYATLQGSDEDQPFILEHSLQRGWKSYWHHIVLGYDGDSVTIHWNGEEVHTTEYRGGTIALGSMPEMEIAAYMNHEPYMQLADLVKTVRIYDKPLTQEEINTRFSLLQKQVNEGILFPDFFHFNAGPYLNYATKTSMNLVWETDREATATIEYGLRVPLDQSISVDKAARIQELTIDNLAPQTTYYYRIKAMAGGEEIDSGLLTFQTAVNEGTPFSFAVIGDTEARPHINSKISKLIWEERPNFMLNVGDLTDGGMQHHKFEWNYEYFVGMTQLNSRVPAFPVPGNGEADLYWYNQYHMLPEPEGYYSFKFGNAEFFMLDSNQRREQFAPGGEQYEWLEKALKKSTATWKFAAHHHPTYTMEENDYGNSWEEPTTLGDLDARQILPLYEGLGIDMVFFGHIHSYERTLPIRSGMIDVQNGVVHLLAGGGGGNLEDFAPTRSWFTNKVYRGHHYALLDIHDQQLTLTMFDTEGRMRDRMEIRKDQPPSPYQVDISEYNEFLTEPQKIEFSSASEADIRYTLDGTYPTARSTLYTSPIQVDDPLLITAATFEEGTRISTVSRARFVRPEAPTFTEKGGLFTDIATVAFSTGMENQPTIRYTMDGTQPTPSSPAYSNPIELKKSTTVTAAYFWPSGMSSKIAKQSYNKASYSPAKIVDQPKEGLHFAYYQGLWPLLPDFDSLTAINEGTASSIDVFSVRQRDDHFGIVYTGYLQVPTDGIYTLYIASDDGSKLYVGNQCVIDNDGQHGVAEKSGEIALKAGLHPIRIEYFEHGGGESLSFSYEGPGIQKQEVPGEALYH